MFQRNAHLLLSTSFAAIALAASLAPAAAIAQDADEASQPEAAQPDAAQPETPQPQEGGIVVTGSRIASASVDSTQPLQVIDSQQIDNSGVTNVQELLLENPVFGTPALSRTNSAFLTTATGVATVDLRDLGSNRTLVLVNGRRVVAGLAGSSAVDLNVIPAQFIQRIDVLTGGASSLYGSDAIAGVVNFIYDNDFEGVMVNGQYGGTEDGDTENYQINATMGSNFSDGRGNIMVHLGYTNEGELLSRDRENTQVDDFDLFRLTLDPNDFGTEFEPFFSGFTPQGSFDVNGTASAADDFTFAPDGTLRPCFNGNGGIAPATCGAFAGQQIGPDGFNRQLFRTLAVPVERYLFAAVGDYEITDWLNVFFEGTYNKTQSSRLIEPFAAASGGTNALYPVSGRAPIETRVQVDTDNDGIPDSFQILVNPLVPQAIVDASQDVDGDGLRDIGFQRRLSEVGNRTNDTVRDFYRFVVGFEGTLADDRLRWDVSYNYGQVTENQVSSGQLNVPNFRTAFAAIPDIDDVDGDGNTAEAICSDPQARAEGCVPVNIFGSGSISDAALAYIDAPGSYKSDIVQQVVQANLSGSLVDLPAGPLGFAVGAEYRKEESSADFDALTNQGLNAGNLIPDTAGEFDVAEAFLELKVPILADKPFFELLELGGAVRVSDYSTIGTVYTYNGQIVWQPVRDVRLRGTYSRAVRAPQIGELFSAQSQTFPTGIVDPCIGVGPSGGGTLGDICRSFPGVNENIAINGTFVATQPDLQGISGFNGGNPDLEEETAETYTAGIVIEPRSLGGALGNLTLTADYYNISIDGVISAPTRPFTLDQCYNQGNQTFCDLITRRPTGDSVNSPGSLEFINAFLVNGALIETEGVDLTARWFTDANIFSPSDRISASIAYTHVFNNDFSPAADAPVDPSAGEIGTAKDRFTSNLNFSSEMFRLNLTGTFIGASTEDDGFCSAFGLDPGCFRQGAEFYLDTQLTFAPIDEFEVYFGVDNLLDNDPPNLLSGTSFNVTGADTAADVYDLFGRRYYAGVRFDF